MTTAHTKAGATVSTVTPPSLPKGTVKISTVTPPSLPKGTVKVASTKIKTKTTGTGGRRGRPPGSTNRPKGKRGGSPGRPKKFTTGLGAKLAFYGGLDISGTVTITQGKRSITVPVSDIL